MFDRSVRRFPVPARPAHTILVACIWALVCVCGAFAAPPAGAVGVDTATGRLIPVQDPAPQPIPATPAVATGAELANAHQYAQAAAVTSGPPIIAVLDFDSSTLPPGQCAALSQALWTRLGLSGAVRLLPRDATRAWLIARDLHPLTPYQRPLPLDRVCRALNAHYLFLGRIDQVGAAYALEYSVYSNRQSTPVLSRAAIRVETLDQLLYGTVDIAAGIAHTLGVPSSPAGAPRAPRASASAWAPAAMTPAPAEPEVKTAATLKVVRVASAKPVDSPAFHEPQERPASAEPASSASAPAMESVALREAAPAHSAEPEHPAEPEPAAAAPTHEPEPTHDASLSEPPVMAEAAPGAIPSAAPDRTPSGPSRDDSSHDEAPHGDSGENAHAETAPSEPAHAEPAHAEPEAPVPTAAERADTLYLAALELPLSSQQRADALTQAVQLAPDNPVYPRQQALDAFSRRQFAEAVRHAERALQLRPEDPDLLLIKGSAHFELKEYEQSLESNHQALRIDPDNNFARYNRAVSLQYMNDPRTADAWRDYLQHAANDPNHAALLETARNNLAAAEQH